MGVIKISIIDFERKSMCLSKNVDELIHLKKFVQILMLITKNFKRHFEMLEMEIKHLI